MGAVPAAALSCLPDLLCSNRDAKLAAGPDRNGGNAVWTTMPMGNSSSPDGKL